MTSKKKIAEYWKKNHGISWSYSESRCWCCSNVKSLEVCHIVPKSLAGYDKPENLFLLCRECHRNSPDCSDPEFFLQWIGIQRGAHPEEVLDAAKLLDVEPGELWWVLSKAFSKNGNEYKHKKILDEIYNKTSTHFGEGYSRGTRAAVYVWIYRTFVSDEGKRSREEILSEKGKVWKKRGEERVYFNISLLESIGVLSYEWFKNGRIKSVYIGGRKLDRKESGDAYHTLKVNLHDGIYYDLKRRKWNPEGRGCFGDDYLLEIKHLLEEESFTCEHPLLA